MNTLIFALLVIAGTTSKVLFFDPRNVPETITSLKSMINSSEGVTQQGYDKK